MPASMSQRVIAIGDIHGCADAFDAIMDLIAPKQGDTVVVLGDVVDRGPKSREAIDAMLRWADHTNIVPILGNHEEMLLAAVDRPSTASSWLLCGGQETLSSYGVKSATELIHEHLLYLRTWGDCYQTNTHFFVHGSYDPAVPLENQEWGYQRWQSLRHMLPAPHKNGKTAIVGHTSQKDGEVLDAGYLVCIDTFCFGGKWLTALDTTTGQRWQVDPLGKLRRHASN